MDDFPVVRSETPLDHWALTVRLDTVQLPDGSERTYVVGSGPPIAFAVPVWDDGTVTLIAQHRHGQGATTPSIEVPGGHVDPGETPLEGAARELTEETGLVAARIEPLTQCLSSAKIHQEWHFALAGDLVEGPHARELDERIELVRLPLSEAVERALGGWVRHGPTMVALLAAHARLGGGT